MSPQFDPSIPFNSLPPLPPTIEVATTAVLRQTTKTARAVAELKGIGQVIPNQSILIDSVILQEAKASSEIENIVTTSDAIYQAFSAKTSKIDPATKEVLWYREALWHGFTSLQERPVLNTNLFIKCVQILKQNNAGIRNAPGTKIQNQLTGEIIYTPPEGETLIRDMLGSLERYIHSETDLDPLIKLAMIHYQFEAIHPFFDGNGRTGRIINLLFLTLQGLLDYPVLYLSKYIIENRSSYYQRLRGVTNWGDWEDWILFILTGIEETAIHTRDQILGIKGLLDETIELGRKKLPSYMFSKELIELLFEQPYTKIQHIVDKGLAKRQTASVYLQELEDSGILKSQKVGKELLYLNTELLKLLSR